MLLLEGLRENIDVTVVGVDAGVVTALVAARPGARGRVIRGVRGKWDLRGLGGHLRAFWALRPHIVHASLQTTWSAQYGLLAALLTPGARAVAVEQLPFPSESGLQRSTKRFVSRRLAAHVAVGERAARLVESNAGLPQGHVQTVYNGLPDTGPTQSGSGEPGGVIGALGRLTEQKGFDLLVRALAELPDARLVIVGEGEERPALEALARELGVEDRFELAGYDAQARQRLAGFDVFALPSRYEGFPLAIVEAMLARLPVVATNVGSVAEAVIDGETGALIPPEDERALTDALARLLGDPDERARLGAAGRSRAITRFLSDVMVADFERLYDEIQR